MERAIEERAATPEPWRVTDQLLDAWLADAEVAPVAVAEMLKPLTINLVRNVVDARAQLAEARRLADSLAEINADLVNEEAVRMQKMHKRAEAAERELATLRAQVGRWADEVAPYVPAKLHSEGEPHRGCCGHHDAMTALAEMRAASTSTGGSAT
jgi:hypothetical protein